MAMSNNPAILGMHPNSTQIDAGTLCRAISPYPGTVGAPVQSVTISIPAGQAEKALEAAWRALPRMPGAIREQVAELLTLRTMVMIGAATAIWAGSHFAGVGFGVDVVLLGIGVVGLGAEGIRAGREFLAFWTIATTARSPEGLDRAAQHFARAVTIVGINTVIALFARTAGRAGAADRALARWTTFIEQLEVKAGNRGALWSKVGSEVAEALARRDGRVTLEILLKKTDFFTRYQAEFGKQPTEVTRSIWELLSRKYAASLEGQVVAYVDNVELFKHIGSAGAKGALPQLTAELEEIAAAMESNPKISSVIVKDVFDGQVVTMTRDAVLNAARRTH
jgi:hypothetical protein